MGIVQRAANLKMKDTKFVIPASGLLSRQARELGCKGSGLLARSQRPHVAATVAFKANSSSDGTFSFNEHTYKRKEKQKKQRKEENKKTRG